MTRRTPGRLHRAIYQLRTEGGSRGREAWAIGLGLFIGCSPLIGLHLGMCFVAGWLFGLNRVKLYLAANLANPLILPALFFAEVQTGSWLRRGHGYPLTSDTFSSLNPWDFGVDLLLGSLIVGGALGAIAGALTYVSLGRRFGDPQFTRLVKDASDRYVASGITAWEFARGKLKNDPIYRWVVSTGLLPARGHVVDVGCGQGLMLALIDAARTAARVPAGSDGAWPDGWAAPPRDVTLTGIELRPRIARMAREALGDAATIVAGDARALAVGTADIVLLFDVLHLMRAADQETLLASLATSLAPGGRLLVREADASAGWRFHAVRFGNRLTAWTQRRWRPTFHFRTADEWVRVLTAAGLRARVTPMGTGTPFGNVLLVAEREERG